MSLNQKIKVAVLYGGRSSEHEISQQSAAAIIKNLDRNKFEVIPIAIDKTGRWFKNNIKQLVFDESLPIKTATSQVFSELDIIGSQDKAFCDVVFPVLHGVFGEDGTVQGLLEMLAIPYVGANVLGSAVGMDKEISKRLVKLDNIPVVPFLSFNLGQWQSKQAEYEKKIQTEIQYPLFVKPANTGSSLGISKVKESADLTSAIEIALHYDTKILVEQALNVREIEVAMLENLQYGDEPLASIAGEIIPNHEFYSYEAKYLDEKGADLVIPAVLEKEQLNQIKDFAVQIFNSLACQGMARVDFFIEKITKKIYFNEVNTIPGFTKISMYPKLWEATGLAYQPLLTHLIELALRRHKRASVLKRSFENN
jgi:D-alanine-D-alanine ligase